MSQVVSSRYGSTRLDLRTNRVDRATIVLRHDFCGDDISIQRDDSTHFECIGHEWEEAAHHTKAFY